MTNACSGRGPALVLVANTRGARIVSRDAITTGSVGIQVALDLSEEYSGLAVTVVFRAGEEQADWAVIDGEPVMVPPQCLQEPGVMLYIGVYASDGDGNKVIPTVWASAGAVRQGVEPSGYDPVGPAPSWAAQVQQAAAEAVETANSVRADAEAGAFDGYSPTATVEQLADGATISITDKDGTTTATIHDGADGATGPEGPAGYSPSARVTQTASGATITVTDQSGTTTADISNGAPGEPGQTGPIGPTGEDGFSPTVDVQPITGGHEVTITDADGAHSFEVMDGDPSAPGSITDEMLAPDGIKPQVAQLWGNQLTGTLSGTIDTTDDAYAAPPMALTVNGMSTQAGTPTPDAPVPILSVDELTLIMESGNITSTEASEWVVGARRGTTGSLNQEATNRITQQLASATPVTALSTYTAYVRSGYEWLAFFFGPNNTYLGYTNAWQQYGQFVVPANATKAALELRRIDDSTMTVDDAALSMACVSTAITTVPDLLPEGTYLRSLPDGTKDELHLSYLCPSTRLGWAWYSREVVQRVQAEDMGDIVWTYLTNWRSVNVFRCDIRNTKSVMCTSYPASASVYTPSDDSYMRNVASWNTEGNLVVRDDSYTNAADFTAAVARQEIQYALQTPVTTQLDPIELPVLPAPNCTVWCDGGSAQPTYQMEYVRDTNIVIAELRAALADLATS